MRVNFCLRSSTALATLAATFPMLSAVPAGWVLTGSAPNNYDVSVDKGERHAGRASACIRSKNGAPESGFGALLQGFKADRYLGRRVRLSANIRAENVKSWAGLWMRADGDKHDVLVLDNMYRRAIKGTTQWARYEVVLEIPDTAKQVFIGVLLDGPGTLWVNRFDLEIVDNSVPLTSGPSRTLPAAPVNLGFEEN